ncbi:MAG TPA: ATP-grasp domain-containing protein [Bradyrhizobium sp.]|nr:ATP-grasp domain-containing protein [Bradyrhizobium sp.]
MKVLIVATDVWPTAARISISLAQVGFRVATVSPARGLVRKIKAVTDHYTYSPWDGSGSIAAAIRAWRPELLVCTDDQAVKHLHDLHGTASRLLDVDSRSLMQLIETSLGNPKWFHAAEQKSVFMTIASQAGVRCPRTWVISDDDDASLPERAPYPILVKADGTCGGKGVRAVENECQAQDAIVELSLPINWPDRVKRSIAKSIAISGIRWKRHRTICLQQQISGRPANRAVACHQGNVLAGISVEALETQHRFGPASIVRVIEHPEMAAIAKTMVERLQLSGLVGFDFILDSRNNAWLIEMNPRVTPICHLHLADGTNLPAEVFSKMTAQSVAPKPPIVSSDTVVLFPGGLWQSNRSSGLSSLYLSSFHDVPWDEPELTRACINYKQRKGLRRHASKLLGIRELTSKPLES